jgi:hypothetical protein
MVFLQVRRSWERFATGVRLRDLPPVPAVTAAVILDLFIPLALTTDRAPTDLATTLAVQRYARSRAKRLQVEEDRVPTPRVAPARPRSCRFEVRAIDKDGRPAPWREGDRRFETRQAGFTVLPPPEELQELRRRVRLGLKPAEAALVIAGTARPRTLLST